MADLPPTPDPQADRPGGAPPPTWGVPGAAPPPPHAAPPPPFAGAAPPYTGIPAAPKTNGLAIASLVLAIVCGGLSAPIAIPLGVIALKQIKDSGGTQGGRPLAIVGIVVSAAFAAIAIVLILAVTLLGSTTTEDPFVPSVPNTFTPPSFDPPTTISIPG